MIAREVVYTYQGKVYPTFAKAKDAAESAVAKFLETRLHALGFSASEAFKVAQVITDSRREMHALLSYPDTERTDDAR